MPESVVAILGSAFHEGDLPGLTLEPVAIETAEGAVTLHRVQGAARPAFVRFRHEQPHQLLPHQIPYRAQALALKAIGCRALLVTSSVGVMDGEVPLFQPLPVSDLLMPDNRLPDGSACTLFTQPSPAHGHLVLEEGLFSQALAAQVEAMARQSGQPLGPPVVFAYVGGPRTKTRAENAFWRATGAHVNAMTLGPEVVLANELEIPTAGIVVGHKHSAPDAPPPQGPDEVAASLVASRHAMAGLVAAFLQRATPVPFANRIFRFG